MGIQTYNSISSVKAQMNKKYLRTNRQTVLLKYFVNILMKISISAFLAE